MKALVNRMLDVAKVEAGQLDVVLQPADLCELVEREVELVRHHPSARDRALTTSLPEGPARVDIDPDRIAQILQNLLSNAAKFSPEGRPIDVAVERNDRRAWVSVADRGSGVSEDLEGRLFSKFGQGRQEAQAGVEGTGLGLYLCRQLARAHGGDLAYAPREGGGSVFRLELPLA